jgi:hypothetical protein
VFDLYNAIAVPIKLNDFKTNTYVYFCIAASGNEEAAAFVGQKLLPAGDAIALMSATH